MNRTSTLRRIAATTCALALVAAACGGGDDSSTDTTSTTTADSTPGTTTPGTTTPGTTTPGTTTPGTTTPGTPGTTAPGTTAPGTTTPVVLETAPGFDGKTVTVGIITDQSSPAAVIARPLTKGLEVYFEAYNERTGGVVGKYPIETLVSDSQYSGSVAVQQYNATKDDVTVISIFGTPVTLAVLEGLKEDVKIGAPASLDSFWAREPNLLPIGGPYQIQSINGVNYAFTDGGGSVTDDVFCVFLQDDAYGEAGLAGVEFAAQKLGIDIASEARYTSGDTDFTTQITQLKGDGCTIIWMTALPTITGGALGKAAELGYTPTWYGQSPTWLGILTLTPLAPYLQDHLRVVTEGPEWGDPSVPAMTQMIADLQKYAPEQGPDIYFTFGYNQASAIASLLEEAAGRGDLSGEGLITAMETLTTDFAGLLGDWTYGPAATRTPPTASSVFGVNPSKLSTTGGLELIAGDVRAPFVGEFEFEARD